MNLDHANAETQDVLDIRHDVGSVPRMQAAAGDQTPGIVFRVVGDELVNLRQYSAISSKLVRLRFMSSSACGLYRSIGAMWMWQSVITEVPGVERLAISKRFARDEAGGWTACFQYNGTFGSTVRAQPSIPPRMDCTFSYPCWRSQLVTVKERTP
jgi:hypothetical protein